MIDPRLSGGRTLDVQWEINHTRDYILGLRHHRWNKKVKEQTNSGNLYPKKKDLVDF